MLAVVMIQKRLQENALSPPRGRPGRRLTSVLPRLGDWDSVRASHNGDTQSDSQEILFAEWPDGVALSNKNAWSAGQTKRSLLHALRQVQMT